MELRSGDPTLTSSDSTPREGNSTVSNVPFQGSTLSPFYPPVCLKYHWDPTAVLRRTLPQGPSQDLALDPRRDPVLTKSGDSRQEIAQFREHLVDMGFFHDQRRA